MILQASSRTGRVGPSGSGGPSAAGRSGPRDRQERRERRSLHRTSSRRSFGLHGRVLASALADVLGDRDRLARLAQAGRRRPPRRERVQERDRLAVEAAQLEERGAVADAVPAELGHELALAEVPQPAGRVDPAPHRHVQKERVAVGVGGRPLHEHARDGRERELGRRAGRHHRIHEHVRDTRAELRQLAVAEARLGIVAAGQVAHRVEAMDGRRREVGVAPFDARHLVVRCWSGPACSMRFRIC